MYKREESFDLFNGIKTIDFYKTIYKNDELEIRKKFNCVGNDITQYIIPIHYYESKIKKIVKWFKEKLMFLKNKI